MAVTRSWETRTIIRLEPEKLPVPAERRREAVWLLLATAVIASALLFTFSSKTRDFADTEGRLKSGELLNVNTLNSPATLAPFLINFNDTAERDAAAERLYEYARAHRPLANVGALAHVHRTDSRGALIPIAKLKPSFVVRTPHQFTVRAAAWTLAFFAVFWLVHLAWRWRRFRGDAAILPVLMLLCGMGLTLALSIRDPLRDTFEYGKFAWGVCAGCLLLLLPLLRACQYQRLSRWVYTPLFAAFALFALLLRFGSGPTGSDARVNLGPFQPVEAVKILLAIFMAGYFAKNWERLRDLRQKRLMPRTLRWLALPRLEHAVPVMLACVCALAFFFLLKDLGPALVTGFLFLALFALARSRAGLALLGIGALVAGVSIGYHLRTPQTVVDRVSMWLSPWDNNVRGGDQLAHSFWALSTGGLWGSGPGRGDPGMIPAGHTDLVLPAIGEEWGFVGVVAIALLFALLARRSYRIALSAPDEYGFFLGAGLATLISLEMLLISAGVLGALPLSGVVSPFLSNGNTAMLANFVIFAMVLSISNQRRPAEQDLKPFRAPVGLLGAVLGVCALLLVARAANFQVLHDTEYLAKDTNVIAADGVKRPQHNPRLNSLAREIPRGNVYDRNGVLLATTRWSDLKAHRAEYAKLGVDIDKACTRTEARHYPFGALLADVLGDLRTGENFHATNASLVEHDSNTALQGYRDYSELAPLIRYRHQPGNQAIARLFARDRDVHTSIDVRLQMRLEEIFEKHLAAAHKDHGAAVVMNAATGEVLAMVSAPEPAASGTSAPDQLLDRARYGLYPPGSTFKLVTAIAALRADPQLEHQTFACRRLPDGRAGAEVTGWRKLIRDDVGDAAHGTIDMARAITVSCNAYFAQLGVYKVGAHQLSATADAMGIPAGGEDAIKKMLPFAAYGQGPVLISPFKMARVTATIANGGAMPEGRWIVDASNTRANAPQRIIAEPQAEFLAAAMRSVVTAGTGRRAMQGAVVAAAGKTGTAQVDVGQPHSWFTGFAPYDAPAQQRIAFAVVVEHGGYGAQTAAPIARDLLTAAAELGIIPAPPHTTAQK